MTADPTPRETVARAIFGIGWAARRDTVAWESSPWLVRDLELTRADAALAALADDPGLAEVLRGHIPCRWTGVTTPDGLPVMTCGRGLPAGPDTLSAHLADVIRAWLRGAS